MDEPRYNPPLDEKNDDFAIGDNIDLITKFTMEQNLGHYGYRDKLRHLNKNILFTNLSRQHGEPEFIQKISRAITILSSHVEHVEEIVPSGQVETLAEDGTTIIVKQVFVRQPVEVRRFDRLETYMSSKIFTVTSTAAGTNAKLLELLRSTFLHKDHTIEDKTKTEGGLWAKLKGKKQQ